jgi:hypothetical protein
MFLLISTAGVSAAQIFSLEPILEVNSQAGRRLTPLSTGALHTNASQAGRTAFVAVVSTSWPIGLVPVFAIESPGSFRLGRLPPRGQENHTEPLFFALPPADETNALKVAGKWSGLASNSQRSNHSPDWELAIDGERVAGRFDPHGEYRVAFITSGLFRSNHLELRVEYINDRYVLNGDWRDGRLSGTWKQLEEAEGGTWEATRPESSASPPPAARARPLFEWQKGSERRYSVETNLFDLGWQRAPRPVCLVWP